ncbi:MAG: 5-deoxy-glucuronate isomerase [Candidatus Dormibacteraeota bacterium]|nr:5-deoxy-glucuronate isomerase [Candidatus Dormibacteraeota bacterium]
MDEGRRWFHPRGSLAREGCQVVVDTTLPGWHHTGLRVAELRDRPLELPAGQVERMVVPLAGRFEVDHTGPGGAAQARLEGRGSVFDGPTDVLYVGAGRSLSVRGTGRVAVAEAVAGEPYPACHLRADQVPVELRGAGASSRQVHNFGVPGVLDAARLIVCEVLTPSGNTSSHPAHKHDQSVEGRETRLEEIYYFEAAVERGLPAPARVDPCGMFATTSSPAGEIETRALVRSGDVALVPFGYHGPAVALPGYDLYYLNVMAGPDPLRAWLIQDDPDQAWIRETWAELPVDARLPYRTPAPGRRTDRRP